MTLDTSRAWNLYTPTDDRIGWPLRSHTRANYERLLATGKTREKPNAASNARSLDTSTTDSPRSTSRLDNIEASVSSYRDGEI